MSNQITGRLVWVGQTFQIPSKTGGAPFLKREFLLDATPHDLYTGQRSQYENILPLEVGGEKCAELDSFRIGDVITVTFALQGREWTNQDGQVKRMVSVRCYRLEARKPAHGQQTVLPVQQPAYQTPSQPFPPTMAEAFPPQMNSDGNPKDELPF